MIIHKRSVYKHTHVGWRTLVWSIAGVVAATSNNFSSSSGLFSALTFSSGPRLYGWLLSGCLGGNLQQLLAGNIVSGERAVSSRWKKPRTVHWRGGTVARFWRKDWWRGLGVRCGIGLIGRGSGYSWRCGWRGWSRPANQWLFVCAYAQWVQTGVGLRRPCILDIMDSFFRAAAVAAIPVAAQVASVERLRWCDLFRKQVRNNVKTLPLNKY